MSQNKPVAAVEINEEVGGCSRKTPPPPPPACPIKRKRSKDEPMDARVHPRTTEQTNLQIEIAKHVSYLHDQNLDIPWEQFLYQNFCLISFHAQKQHQDVQDCIEELNMGACVETVLERFNKATQGNNSKSRHEELRTYVEYIPDNVMLPEKDAQKIAEHGPEAILKERNMKIRCDFEYKQLTNKLCEANRAFWKKMEEVEQQGKQRAKDDKEVDDAMMMEAFRASNDEAILAAEEEAIFAAAIAESLASMPTTASIPNDNGGHR